MNRRTHQADRVLHRGAPRGAQRCGTTTVEFAVVVPVVLALFFGSIELTRLNFLRHTAANAAYEAARVAIVPGATMDDAVSHATELLGSVGAGHSATIDVNPTPESVEVVVTIPVNANSWGLGRFTNNFNLVESCTLRREASLQ